MHTRSPAAASGTAGPAGSSAARLPRRVELLQLEDGVPNIAVVETNNDWFRVTGLAREDMSNLQ